MADHNGNGHSDSYYFVCDCNQSFFSHRNKEKCPRCRSTLYSDERQQIPWMNGQQKNFITWVSAEKLNIANIGDATERYQRDRQTNADGIARNFQMELFDAILVGERADGSLWVVDGQQRTLACREHGVTRIPARVFKSRGKSHEAEVFLRASYGRKQLKPVDDFRAALADNDVAACECKRICAMLAISIIGIDVPAREPKLACISGLLLVYSKFKSMALTRSLRICLECWRDQKDKFKVPPIYGIAKICAYTHAPDQWLVDRLKKTSVAALMQRVSAGQLAGEQRNEGFAKAALDFCNARRGAKYEWIERTEPARPGDVA